MNDDKTNFIDKLTALFRGKKAADRLARSSDSTPAAEQKPTLRARRFLVSGSLLTLAFRFLYESEDRHDRR